MSRIFEKVTFEKEFSKKCWVCFFCQNKLAVDVNSVALTQQVNALTYFLPKEKNFVRHLRWENVFMYFTVLFVPVEYLQN